MPNSVCDKERSYDHLIEDYPANVVPNRDSPPLRNVNRPRFKLRLAGAMLAGTSCYVDPGSGYLLLQVVGSMLAGAAFFIRHRLKRMLGLAADYDPTSARSSSATREEK